MNGSQGNKEEIKALAEQIQVILQRANTIDEQLSTLELMKNRKAKQQKTKPKKAQPINYVHVPRTIISEQDGLQQMMELIFEIKRDVSALTTRQNEISAELEYLRSRIC